MSVSSDVIVRTPEEFHDMPEYIADVVESVARSRAVAGGTP